MPVLNPEPSTKERLRQALMAASHDLVRGQPDRMTPEQARQLRLASWSFHAGQAGSPHRRELAADFAQYWRTQQLREKALVPLLRAWQEAGIEAVAIKGLAMARWIYPHPAARFCGDADLLLRLEDAQRVRSLNVPGWTVMDPLQHLGDERRPFGLWHEEASCSVDAHVSLLKQFGFPQGLCERFSAQIEAGASHQFTLRDGLDDVAVKAPAAADLLMVLAANRGWGDRWHHKPHDYLDMALTIQRHGLTAEALLQRASELGIRSTWLSFLRHCNPFEQRFDLALTRFSPAVRLSKSLSTAPGGLPPRVRAGLRRARRAGPNLWRVGLTVPTFLGVLNSLRQFPTPAEAAAEKPANTPLPAAQRWAVWQVEQAARWVCYLLRPLEERAGAGPCVVRSLTLFRLLQKHGHSCEWFLGYRSVPGESPIGHAWVTCEDPYVLGLSEHLHNRNYSIVYRHKYAAS